MILVPALVQPQPPASAHFRVLFSPLRETETSRRPEQAVPRLSSPPSSGGCGTGHTASESLQALDTDRPGS